MPSSQRLPATGSSALDMETLRSQLFGYFASHPEERNALRALSAQFFEEDAVHLTARSNMRGHLTASLLLLDPSQTQALLIDHKHIGAWIPPGGHVDEGEASLWLAALREAEEETGFPRALAVAVAALTRGGVPQPLDIHSQPIKARPSKSEGPHIHHDLLFLARAGAPFEISHQEAEVAGAQWFDLARFPRMPHPRLHKIAAKLRILGIGPTLPEKSTAQAEANRPGAWQAW